VNTKRNDDQFFDCIGNGIKRLKEMNKHEWRKCEHLENLVPIGKKGDAEEKQLDELAKDFGQFADDENPIEG